MTDREWESRNAGEQEGSEFLPHDPRSARDASKARTGEPSLEPWLAGLVQDAMHVDDNDVPRDLMWARIRQQRREAMATTAERAIAARVTAEHAVASRRRVGAGRTIATRVLAIAATLAIGVAIGRYGTPGATPNGSAGATGVAAAGTAAPAAVQGIVPEGAPAVVAMEEHLARTVALLVTVRDQSPSAGSGSGSGADVSGWARELLGTTRMLLDEPQLRDDRTRRLLQDLELVLVQIIQARGTAAPEAQRAPSETMRETNLLPRVRAVVTASNSTAESSLRGIADE